MNIAKLYEEIRAMDNDSVDYIQKGRPDFQNIP